MIIANGIREALHAHGVHSSTIQPEFGDADDGTLDVSFHGVGRVLLGMVSGMLTPDSICCVSVPRETLV